jgi:hypothetical protein
VWVWVGLADCVTLTHTHVDAHTCAQISNIIDMLQKRLNEELRAQKKEKV